MAQKIRVTVWNEFVHERKHEHIKAIYPDDVGPDSNWDGRPYLEIDGDEEQRFLRVLWPALPDKEPK